MDRDVLNKKLAGCTLKTFYERNRHNSKAGLPFVFREDCEPRYCEHASESERPGDPVCEVVRRRIADLERCPLSSATPRAAADDSGMPLLNGISWNQTKK
jgi:hypothetical protein